MYSSPFLSHTCHRAFNLDYAHPLCIYGPDDHIPFPSASDMLDYELAIGCVIGREGRNVREADAMDYIAGFSIFNDWSGRDLQPDESAVGLGPAKGKDAASTLGPWLVTTDELAPYMRNGRLQVKCHAKVNGGSIGEAIRLGDRRRRQRLRRLAAPGAYPTPA